MREWHASVSLLESPHVGSPHVGSIPVPRSVTRSVSAVNNVIHCITIHMQYVYVTYVKNIHCIFLPACRAGHPVPMQYVSEIAHACFSGPAREHLPKKGAVCRTWHHVLSREAGSNCAKCLSHLVFF